jgi:hypothetical protein
MSLHIKDQSKFYVHVFEVGENLIFFVTQKFSIFQDIWPPYIKATLSPSPFTWLFMLASHFILLLWVITLRLRYVLTFSPCPFFSARCTRRF